MCAAATNKVLHPVQTICNKVLESMCGAFDILLEDNSDINRVTINLVYDDHMVIAHSSKHNAGIGMQFNSHEYQYINDAPDFAIKEVVSNVWERLLQLGHSVISVTVDPSMAITFILR